MFLSALGLSAGERLWSREFPAAVALNALFLRGAWQIRSRTTAAAEGDNFAVEKRFFRLSLLYLFLHFGALLADAALRGLGWGIW